MASMDSVLPTIGLDRFHSVQDAGQPNPLRLRLG